VIQYTVYSFMNHRARTLLRSVSATIFLQNLADRASGTLSSNARKTDRFCLHFQHINGQIV